jgi:hypothetical protein
MPPGILALHIHHVVEAFQINKAIYVQRKNWILFWQNSSSQRSGTNAKKIKTVKGETGQEAYKRKPDNIERKRNLS